MSGWSDAQPEKKIEKAPKYTEWGRPRATACRRIDPKTGAVIEEIPARESAEERKERRLLAAQEREEPRKWKLQKDRERLEEIERFEKAEERQERDRQEAKQREEDQKESQTSKLIKAGKAEARQAGKWDGSIPRHIHRDTVRAQR